MQPNIATFAGGRHHVGFGPEEAEDFRDGYLDSSEWLNDIQNTDAFYCYPDFYGWAEDNIEGIYDLFPGFSFLLPYRPFALTYDRFKKTGERAHAHTWSVCFTDVEAEKEMGKLPYDVFLEVLEQENLTDQHDAHCFMLPSLTREDINLILNCGQAILEERKNNDSEDSQED